MRGVGSVMQQILGDEQYLTACYARLNRSKRQLSVVSAGHPPVIRVRASGLVDVVSTEGDPLGVFSSAVLRRHDLRVGRGDRFYLYTDGFIEATAGSGRHQGLEKLVEACVRCQTTPLAESAATIAQLVRPDASAIQDDLLLLTVEALP